MSNNTLQVPQDILDTIQVGKSIHFETGDTAEKVHILAIVDDFMVVSKSWGKSSKRWHYEIRSYNHYNLMREFIKELNND